MTQGWDDRFATEDYVFGTEPAQGLTRNADLLPTRGRALCVAEGEGRNAVWLAERGLDVTAFDASATALEKARRLAGTRGVAVDFRKADAETFDWGAESYDLVVAIFIQFAGPDLRDRIFAGLKTALAPGGTLVLHGYRPEQVDLGTGGPPHRENMYTEAMLREAFGDLTILRLDAYDTVIEEGRGHNGPSALIDLVARA